MTIEGAAEAIEIYGRASGAEEILCWAGPEARVRHAEGPDGDAPVVLAEEAPEFGMAAPRSPGGSPAHAFICVDDADATFGRALAAGATELMPAEDGDDGDRRDGVTDPSGRAWYTAARASGHLSGT